MNHSAITGWGKCLPPAVITNDDLATFLDTSDEWITARTGIKERRISHVGVSDLAYVAASRALAAAGLDPASVDMIIVGTCTADSMVPNVASGVQSRLGAWKAGCYDINTVCTSFSYGLCNANALIKSGVIRNAVVIGADTLSHLVPWKDRNISILFGDGAAACVLEASDQCQGVLAQRIGCLAEARDTLHINWGMRSPGDESGFIRTPEFRGQEIFRHAVKVMAKASEEVIEEAGFEVGDIDICVPHQANKRIVEALAQRIGIPTERCFVNVHRYGNMSSATLPLALTEAVEEQRVAPGALMLCPSFGAGLTWTAHLIKWGERNLPKGQSDVELPPCDKTGMELVEQIMFERGDPLTIKR